MPVTTTTPPPLPSPSRALASNSTAALKKRLQRIGHFAVLIVPMLSACGGGSDGSVETPVPPPASSATLSLLAGYPLSEGNQDGPTSTTASFSTNVGGMALTSSGEVVIADTNNSLIRKLSANGEQVSTLAGGWVPSGATPGTPSSYSDGNGQNARFYRPAAVAVDAAGNTYVADTANHLVRKISAAGLVTTLAGRAGVCGNQDGAGNGATLCNPSSIAVDKTGTVYVSEAFLPGPTQTGRIRKITADGAVSTIASQTRGRSPLLATDSAGTLYAADAGLILKYSANGLATAVSGTEGQLGKTIVAMTFDSADRLIVLDKEVISELMLGPPSIRYVRLGIRHVGSDGRVTTLVSAPSDCHNYSGRSNDDLCQAITMVAKADGQFLVAEGIGGSSTSYKYVQLRRYTQQGKYTVVAGPVSPTGAKDGQGDAARFDQPSALAFDASGMLYVRDKGNNTIRTVQADGVVGTLGQPGGRCTSITGLGRELLVSGVSTVPGSALAADGAGNLYTYIDSRILKLRNCEAVLLADVNPLLIVDPSTGTGRPAVNPITGIAADSTGNVYASSYQGVIFKIDTKGTATLFAGSEAQWGHRDGQGQAARFSWLGNMTTDAAGNLYVVDSLNNFKSLGPTIRKITPSGLVSTLAGNPDASPGHADGLGSAALFSVDWPEEPKTASLAVDNKGNVYVSDPANSVIRKITPDGQVSTPVGQVGRRGFAAVDLPGSIGRPAGIAIRDSRLYISVPHAVIQVRLPD
ncbi:hypothetical protein [Acidovorax sp.]|uniref:hypothetical protein n=1 Tax=Acidovorax sp. TaxID=1872122 RepID=UPI002ACD5EB9|nr:hypothetical protein [Acidovorax sp.]MDZ7865145.1 hypothetical protein [Acidovorax sp.]